MTELKCERCGAEGIPITETLRQEIRCYQCKVKFPWHVAGKFWHEHRKEKDAARRKEYNDKTTKRYRLK